MVINGWMVINGIRYWVLVPGAPQVFQWMVINGPDDLIDLHLLNGLIEWYPYMVINGWMVINGIRYWIKSWPWNTWENIRSAEQTKKPPIWLVNFGLPGE